MPESVNTMTSSSAATANSEHEEGRPAEKRKTKRQLNIWFLVGTLIAAAVLGPAAYFWREFQVRRTAKDFLIQAETLEAEENWSEAAGYLFRYLRLHPNDADARIRLAKAFDKSAAQNPQLMLRAVDLYYSALGVASEERKSELRARLAELLLEVGLFYQDPRRISLAETEALALTETDEEGPRGLRVLALARYAQYSFGGRDAEHKVRDADENLTVAYILAEEFEKALEQNPGDIDLANRLAWIYRSEPLLLSEGKQALAEDELQKLADDLMDQMVEANADDVTAHLARYRYRQEYGLTGAEDDLNRALELDPNDLETLSEAAVHSRREAARIRSESGSTADGKRVANKHLIDACKHYAHIIAEAAPRNEADLAPRIEWAYVGLGDVCLAFAQTGLAVGNQFFEECPDLAKATETVTAWHEMARKVWERGRDVVNPNSVELNSRLAGLYLAQGHLADANDALDRLSQGAKQIASSKDRPERLELDRTINILRAQYFVAKSASGITKDELREVKEALKSVLGKSSISDVEAVQAHQKDMLNSAEGRLKRLLADRPTADAEAVQAYQAEMLLGRVHDSLARLDREDEDAFLKNMKLSAEAFERAARLQPKLPAPRVAAFGARATTSEPTEAIKHYDQAISQSFLDKEETVTDVHRSEAGYRLALSHFQRETRLPKERRNWAPFDAAVSRLMPVDGETSLENAWRLDILRASYLVEIGAEQGDREKGIRDAMELLHQTEEQEPYTTSAEFLQQLVLGYEKLKAPEDADRVMEKLETLTGKSATTYVLRSSLYSSRKQFEKAREILVEGIGTLPPSNHAALRQTLARVNLREDQQKRLELYQEDQTNVELISQFIESAFEQRNLLEVRHWEQALRKLEGPDSPHADYAKARQLLAGATLEDARFREGVELLAQIERKEPNSPQIRMLRGMVLQAQGKSQEAVEAYRDAIRLGAQDVPVFEEVVALLVSQKQFDEARAYLAKAKGHGLSSKRLSALEIAVAEGEKRLEEAEQLARRMIADYPEDLLTRTRYAQLLVAHQKPEEAEAAFQEAIEEHQKAIRSGTQTVSVYEQLVALLGDRKQFDEARKCLSTAEERGLSSKKLRTLAVAIAVADKRLDEAEALARNMAAEDSEDPLAQLSYARLLVANKKPEEAEAAFKEAIQRAPADARVHGALFDYYLQAEQNDLARQTLEEIEKQVDLPKVQLASVLAAGYERLGDVEKADANYREAQRLEPDDIANGMRLADFLARNDKTDEAEAILRGIVEEDPRADAARYRLADVLAARGGRAHWQEALQVLEQSGDDENVLDLDDRLQALLLIRRAGRENLEKATKLLEGLVLETENPADADRLLLIQVYQAEIDRLEGEGDAEGAAKKLQAAQEQYLALVGRTNATPAHLASYAEFLIRNNQAGAASGYIDQLEKLAPDNLGAAQLRVRWLQSQDRAEEIKPLVENLAKKLLDKNTDDDPRKKVQVVLNVGRVYSGVELHQEAESWYRRLQELEPKAYAPLVTALAQQGRMQDVIKVCLEAAQSDQSTRPALVLASALVSGKASDEECRQAEPLLQGAKEAHPDNIDLLFSLANLRIFQKQMDEAAKLYQRVLELDPKHLITLNNLATVLSELPGRSDEALETIDRAIDLAGERAPLLDTKGMILVYAGKPEQAVPFLEAAAFSSASDPRYHFHLAVAYNRTGNADKARNALREATGGNLKNEFLTEMDLLLLAELEEELRD